MYNSAFSNFGCKTQKTRCITPVSQGLFSSIVAGQKYLAPQKVRNQSVLQKRQKTYILNFIAIFQQRSTMIIAQNISFPISLRRLKSISSRCTILKLPYLHSTVFPVRCPIEGVSTVFDNVSCYILSEVGPSLCRDLDNFSWPPKVKLYPLSSFVYFSRPSTTVVPAFSVVQPR